MSANISIHPFGLDQMELTDALCQNALRKDIAYLLSLEPERLLVLLEQLPSVQMLRCHPLLRLRHKRRHLR